MGDDRREDESRAPYVNLENPTDNVRDKVLRRMKIYFMVTGQYIEIAANSPTTINTKRILYGLLQLTIACLAALYVVYTVGTFANSQEMYHIENYFFHYPITAVDNIIWEVRWLLTCWIGIRSTKGIWEEMFSKKNIKNLHLGEDRWKKMERLFCLLAGALILMCVIAEVAYAGEINFEITRTNVLPVVFDALFMLVVRVLAFPLFFLFCMTMYILCCEIDKYRHDIVEWKNDSEAGTSQSTAGNEANQSPDIVEWENDGEPGTSQSTAGNEANQSPTNDGLGNASSSKETINNTSKDNATGDLEAVESKNIVPNENDEAAKQQVKDNSMNEARERFKKIKAAIRNAGLRFECYLTVHFLLLVCTFFLGVCSCFEQMEVRIGENSTMTLPFQVPHFARFVNFYGNLTLEKDYTAVGSSPSRSARLLTSSTSTLYTIYSESGKHAGRGVNSTDPPDDFVRTEWLKRSMKYVVICVILRTLESLLLYFFPIALMVRLQNRLRRVYEVIEDSNIEEQKKKSLLFGNVQAIRCMCKYVKTAHGLKIYGYTVPTFEAFMLAAFGPFFAAVVQRLLSYIHMKQG